jgi:hypothetical protein
MDVLFVSSVAVISADPPARKLFVDALGLPLAPHPGSEYYSSEKVEGTRPGVCRWQKRRRPASAPPWPSDRGTAGQHRFGSRDA